MIGNLLDLSKNTESGTQHCPHKCLRKQFRCVKRNKWNRTHLEDICPLRSQRKDHSNRLFLLSTLKRITIRCSGICLSPMRDILILLLLCKSSLIKRSVVTGVIIHSIIQTMRFLFPCNGTRSLTTYKYGWKTSYYQNTYDFKTDELEETNKSELDELISQIQEAEEEDCESCKI